MRASRSVNEASAPPWLKSLVAAFGTTTKAKLAGPGDREAAIRAPLEQLLTAVGKHQGLHVVPHDEVRDVERGVRPDYGIRVQGAIAGYLEVKRPGLPLDPEGFTGHDLRQWQRLSDLPNLLYTNGTEWRLWRGGQLVGDPIHLTGGSLANAGKALDPPGALALLLTDFLEWSPAPIGSVSALVRAVAPMTRLLRGEVIDQLATEKAAVAAGASEHDQPFRGLARDWRALLFPEADDRTFADGYAQTVAFGLLLARSEGIDLANGALHQVGQDLGKGHSLMGRALQLLTDDVASDFRITLDLMVRVIAAVDWKKVRGGKRDTYLYLYEEFLQEYDPELRRASGSYYTPRPLVDDMVRLAQAALTTHLDKPAGFRDDTVITVDPAMGTGTYLNAIIEQAARQAIDADGPGVAAGAISQLAERLIGFELQMGPYAVTELRTTELLRSHGATPPKGGMKTYVTDALADPFTAIDQLGSNLQAISASRRKANAVKADTPVTVVIGNPPYAERAEGRGGWVERGRAASAKIKSPVPPPLDDFRAEGNGLNEYVLKNLYVYFWRWATWKVFDAHSDASAGVVCLVTTNGYLLGRGFAGMREYLRRTASEGWVINLTPEGQRPPIPTRLFPGVQQPLCVALFVRQLSADRETPAPIHYCELVGSRADKLAQLSKVSLEPGEWRPSRTSWQAPFTPAAHGDWDAWPAAADLFPWTAPGVKPNRTWVYAPEKAVLTRRWQELVPEPDTERKRALFQSTDSTSLETEKQPLKGKDTHSFDSSFQNETASAPKTVQVSFRAFDRQWLIPDSRLIHRPSPDLWAARINGQTFITEQSAHAIHSGPALAFSALIPDMHHFNGRGGRVLPALHPDGSSNLAPGLLDALQNLWASEEQPLPEDVPAYVAAVVAHPYFTATFEDQLSTPGVRIPITSKRVLWDKAVLLGREVIWVHTYGASYADPNAERPKGNIRYKACDPRQPLARAPVTGMPGTLEFDSVAQELRLGTGTWSPVSPAVRGYEVGDRNVLDSWFNYRKANPTGRRTKTTSPLAYLHTTAWPPSWSTELVDVLTALTRLVELEDKQRELLDEVMANPLTTATELTAFGTAWPQGRKDRKPHPVNESEGSLF